MAGNTTGKLFQITTFGEAHGPALGVVIDGCPAGLRLDLSLVESELQRRRTGQSKYVSARREDDVAELLSGVFEGTTTGTPLCFLVRNTDARSKDYERFKDLFRPGHADFGYFAKYGIRDYRGGGRSSARETTARVIGGAVAKQILGMAGIRIYGGVTQIGTVQAQNYVWEQVEENELRGVDPLLLDAMRQEIESARSDRDSIGGAVELRAEGVPPGLGEPVFDRLDARIASAMMSIPAVKGVELGAGFGSAALRGSEMNDPMTPDGFLSNHHGGVLGGISSGAPIVVRFAVKPTSSIPKDQQTIDTSFASRTLEVLGRHDACVAIRAVPIAEAMLALVLVDFYLEQLAQLGIRQLFAPHTLPRYGLRHG